MGLLRPGLLLLCPPLLAFLGGCDKGDPLRPGDVACLDYMMAPFGGGGVSEPARAMGLCQTRPLPDLTGDSRLQAKFLSENIPFQIRPKLDARLKFVRRWETGPEIGSNIPDPDITYDKTPTVTVTEHDPTPVNGATTSKTTWVTTTH